MNTRYPLPRSLQLRESYLGISRYFYQQQALKSRIAHGSQLGIRPNGSLKTNDKRQFCSISRLQLPDSETPNSPARSRRVKDKPLSRYVRTGNDRPQVPRKHNLWQLLANLKEIPEGMKEGSADPTFELSGYITSQRTAKRQLHFLQLVDPALRLTVQLKVELPEEAEDAKTDQHREGRSDALDRDTTSLHVEPSGTKLDPAEIFAKGEDVSLKDIHTIRPHTPVTVRGQLQPRVRSQRSNADEQSGTATQEWVNTIPALDPYVGHLYLIHNFEIQVHQIKKLNSFPADLVAQNETSFGPESRHLQFRTDHKLRRRIRLRSQAMAVSRKNLFMQGFDEIETPLLFKSTPEGAREFLVPTRKRGLAYALPQSPQQYKQLLMASGIARYFQFAKCFRDEDLRADRQPEFTQLDLEMAFANAQDVMAVVENVLLVSLWPLVHTFVPHVPLVKVFDARQRLKESQAIPRYTYQQVMSAYGSDKPDLRLKSEIVRIDEWVPDNLKSMLTSLDNPVVEMLKIEMNGTKPQASGRFVASFLRAPSSSPFVDNPHGMPGVTVFDPRKPLNGLASFGYEGAAKAEERFQPEPGDILIVQTRPDTPFTGGATPLGNLRRDMILAAISQGFRETPQGSSMLWVTDFPLFSPIDEGNVGQGGGAGICSTHHPFTAPKDGQDLSKLVTDPLSVIGDHYDLVINGIEVGGGSRRIHMADMQEFILKDVLKMEPERVEDFRHLLKALQAGCPPHAGFALGFDRMMAVLAGVQSVRDVIAFPKYGDGEDKFVGSPVPMTAEQLSTYHLNVSDEVKADEPPKVSLAA